MIYTLVIGIVSDEHAGKSALSCAFLYKLVSYEFHYKTSMLTIKILLIRRLIIGLQPTNLRLENDFFHRNINCMTLGSSPTSNSSVNQSRNEIHVDESRIL